MWKNTFSLAVVFILIVLVFVMNFTPIGEKQAEPNIIDVSGDTSVDGVAITAPNVKQLQEGEIAPNFILSTLNGKKIEALNQSQEYIFLNFWATWCPPCVEEMPNLQTFQDNHPERVKILAVNVTETEPTIKKIRTFVDNGSFTFTILLDKDNTIYERYSIINMPTSFMIRTSDKKVMKRINGAVTLEQMEQLLKEFNS
ncbi:cytochrome c-type biogenesis protein CcmG/DsbE [Gracilibacillus boraciitolerans JCM 21714]|uniref:Cytochrome c-type biogenesis protein CcmG/DsbE n=1 Tax=Gracilibacillus boraciitolerans JCM 21714 TaxID=1298598 RepID=W4VE85_9BACI|nr:redoxin domain-containing protein [Gracilibacillus boraciitolerans]GAE91507.1 cytochrome c-type biogenesis protein CcmG/DsbE [Gracilibacillus boraciitolerans JCM 21714]